MTKIEFIEGGQEKKRPIAEHPYDSIELRPGVEAPGVARARNMINRVLLY